ncbi:hypothetical protein [Loktanella salsilacus]|uniref:hypothetical protein n=1 Tax=Loktanella salsilacus TaxID=195913 RepID=UPI00345E82D5
MIAEIARRGHEIACHSYCHQLVYTQTPDEFESDLVLARDQPPARAPRLIARPASKSPQRVPGPLTFSSAMELRPTPRFSARMAAFGASQRANPAS